MDHSSMASWDSTEFAHIKDSIYLDHAGATPYCRSQLEAHYKDLTSGLYGNPHSNNPSSKRTSEALEYTRELVLRHFNTTSDCYNVVFTSGCTAALRLVADVFPWSGKPRPSTSTDNVLYCGKIEPNLLENQAESSDNTVGSNRERSWFCYLEDNHTSVLGMRRIASQFGAKILCVTENAISQKTGHLEQSSVNAVSHEPGVLDSTTSPGTDSVSLDSIPRDTVSCGRYHLFAYPGQSNFSGRKYPLSWTLDVPDGRTPLAAITGQWLVVVDAASYAATNQLDLTRFPAHFVALSFYKMFGYPTGVGALLVRNDTISDLLEQTYFGGGTVVASVARCGFYKPRPLLHERLENGTVSFLDIISLRHGFEALSRFGLGMEAISQHTFCLARHVRDKMAAMRHGNDTPLCVLYHTGDFSKRSEQGGIVTFNLLQPNGNFIGYSEVDKLACVYGIQLRTGCFCNPGACQSALGLTTRQILDNMKAGHTCGDDVDIINGSPTGCIRASFGYMSTYSEANSFLKFLQDCFLVSSAASAHCDDSSPAALAPVSPCDNTISTSGPSSTFISTSDASSTFISTSGPSSTFISTSGPSSTFISTSGPSSTFISTSDATVDASTDTVSYQSLSSGSIVTAHTLTGATEEVVLDKLLLYPVKSCAGFEVSSWPLSDTGLRYDRQWMIVNEHNGCVTQKQNPTLARIGTNIDLNNERLNLSLEGDTISLPIREGVTQCNTRVCGDKVEGGDCGTEVAEWLQRVLNKPYRLVRKSLKQERRGKMKPPGGDGASKVCLSLSNEAQYLLVTWSAVEYVHRLMGMASNDEGVVPSLHNVMLRFRPNIVIKMRPNAEAFSETKWAWLSANDDRQRFQVVGECMRCNMVCVDPTNGNVSRHLLQTLLSLKGTKPTFGIYLSNR